MNAMNCGRRLIFDLAEPDGQLRIALDVEGEEVGGRALGEMVDDFIAECLDADGADRAGC